MADETTPAPPAQEPAAPRRSPTASIRFGNEAEQARWYKVYEKGLEKRKWRNQSDFILKMFTYIEKNPYGDFPNT